MTTQPKMSKAQRDQLARMAQVDVTDISDESIVKALARRGYAERYSKAMGHLHSRHVWRITDAGRSALSQGRSS